MYQYTRLPFGVSSAPSIFQSVMDQVLLGIPGTSCYLDDILIGGSDLHDAKQKLFQVLDKLNEFNIKINLSKCKFFRDEIDYLGHTISQNGLKPNNGKVEAIANAPSPKNLSELQSYLGMLNYYSSFVPNLSSELKELYDLLGKDRKFIWTENIQNCFEKSKKLLLNNNLLELYDQNKPIIVTTDASPYGVGAVLAHLVNGVEKPVLFASSTLSPSEKNYSQIHREALAVMFGIKKFHKYIYGHKFTLCSDNEALKEIFNPNRDTSSITASRLQRWAVMLSIYEYEFKYRPAKRNAPADAMSRLPLENETQIESINNLANVVELPIHLEKVREYTLKDSVLGKVLNYVKNGWPLKMPQQLEDWYKFRGSLSTEDNCNYYRDRLVIPETLRGQILETLHENHDGIARLKMLSRSSVWWPKIDRSIEEYVLKCFSCQSTYRVPREQVLTKWPLTNFPFERVHLDLFYFESKTFLIYIDSFSKFIEVKYLIRSDAINLCNRLLSIFKLFGYPKEIVTDNGPPFSSFYFEEFAKKLNIDLRKSPPYHPQSNGLAERGVQTIKNSLKKYLIDEKLSPLPVQTKLDKILMCYNNTPCTTTSKSPASFIFSFTPRTIISSLKKTENVNLKFENPKSINKKGQRNNDNIFKIGDKVLYRNHFKDIIKWIPATVFKVISTNTYLINVKNSIKYVHKNQLRFSKLSNKYHLLLNNEFTEKRNLSNNKNKRSNVNHKKSKKKIEKRVLHESIPIRKSNRIKKKPSRLQYK